jgi:hypothetical protein
VSDNGKEPERALVNRGDDPYPNDIKAEAVALVYESGNFSEAARTMAERYPERAPSRQLITRWFSQVDAEAFAALSTERKAAFESGIIELADKARQKMYDALDDMKPQQVPIPAGIAMDKGLRLLEAERRGGSFSANAQNIQINFISQEKPDIIEGEVVKDGDGPS